MKKKMLISIAIIAILLLNCIAPILKVAAGTDIKVMFEKNMYAAIKDELQRQGITAIYNDAQRTMIINDEELAKVTSLSLSNSELTDLTGLEIFTNLKELDLSSNELDKTSNLEVLNSFTLTTLDLSSNEIEDLSMVTNIKNISKLNLHNQKFDVVEIIQVDNSSESDQYNGVLYPLPKILTDFVDYIPSEWLLEKSYRDNGQESYEKTPYIEWSKFDHENLKVIYANKTAVSYEPLKGMVKVSIKVIDSTSTLYNSDINLYFVTAITDTSDPEETIDERGIHIKDINLYNAIKKQLTKGQTENSKLISYGTESTARTLYNRSFDDAQTLVISIDDLINKITNLKLDNKRIKDLSGIEYFIGLETELDVSGNYIKSIEPLLKLEENQEKEEALLRERVQKQIALVSETIAKIDSTQAQIDSVQSSIDGYNKQNAELNSQRLKVEAEIVELNRKKAEINDKVATLREELERLQGDDSVAGSIANLEKEIDTLNTQLSTLNTEKTNLLNTIATKTSEIASLENNTQAQKDAIESKKAELEAAKNTLNTIQNDITNKQAEINAKIEEINVVKDSVENINVSIAIYETEIADLNTQIVEKQAEINTLISTGAIPESSIGSAREELNNYVNRVSDEISKLNNRIEELRRQINEDDENRRRLESELNDLKGELDRLNENKRSAENRIPELEAEVRRLENDLASDPNTRRIAELRAEIENIKNVDIPKKDAEIESKKQEIEQKRNTVADYRKRITDKQAEVTQANKELEEIQKNIDAKIEEANKFLDSINKNNEAIADLRLKLAELQADLARYQADLVRRMKRLYTIYNRVDRLTAFTVVGIRELTDEKFYDMSFEESKSLFNAQVSKISSIEKYLTGFEASYLIGEYGIPTTRTVKYKELVRNDDGTTTEVEREKTEPIENPISKYFSELANEEWTMSNYKYWINNFQRDDIYFAMYAYCYFVRYFEGTSNCVANGYADYIIERLEIEGEDTRLYENAKAQYPSIYARYAGNDNCAGTVGDGLLYTYGKRITLATGEDINAYITLPRLKVLDISENLIENIDNISKLTKLVKLYAGDNEIVDISKVDWTSMNEHLKVLDLSLNDISNIEPLEVLTNIEYLDLSKNLIEGEFTFKVEKLEKIKHLDLSYNRIDDIQRLINYLTYEARAHGYNGDIASYLRNGDFSINFKYQQLEMTVDGVLPVGDTYKVELPKFFRQIEEIDYANTSFGIDSIRGNVTSDGKEVIVDTRVAGKHTGVVTIINTKTTASFGYGTTCTITYKVGTANTLEVKVTPEDAKVTKGSTQQFRAEVTGDNVPYTGVTWSISGNTSENTKISENGLLTVATDEASEKIEVIATSFYDSTAIGKVEVIIEGNSEEPTNPGDNKDPETPTNPDDNKDPETPTNPGDNKDPETPTNPDDNKDPETPTNPDDNKDPETPTNPDDNKDPETPTNPDDNKDPETPANPDDKKDETTTIEFGYDVDLDNDYLVGIKAQTSVDRFKSVLLNDNEDYRVVVKSANREVTTGNIGTGMFAQVQDKNGNVVKDTNGNLLVYEIIVKGDVNGDGVADSLDTVSIKSHRSEVKLLKGAALKAADINSDNSVDSTDSKLLLYHRAEVSGYNLNYTK